MEALLIQYGIQYGLPAVIELIQLLQKKESVTLAEWEEHFTKTLAMTADDYIKEAKLAKTTPIV